MNLFLVVQTRETFKWECTYCWKILKQNFDSFVNHSYQTSDVNLYSATIIDSLMIAQFIGDSKSEPVC